MTQSSESEYLALFSEQERDGLTVREFAAVQGIAAATFDWLRSKSYSDASRNSCPVEVVPDDSPQSGRVDLHPIHD